MCGTIAWRTFLLEVDQLSDQNYQFETTIHFLYFSMMLYLLIIFVLVRKNQSQTMILQNWSKFSLINQVANYFLTACSYQKVHFFFVFSWFALSIYIVTYSESKSIVWNPSPIRRRKFLKLHTFKTCSAIPPTLNQLPFLLDFRKY